MSQQQPSQAEVRRNLSRAMGSLIIWIIVYIVVVAIINQFIIPLAEKQGLSVSGYAGYINIGLALLFGYFIVRAFANIIYWFLRLKYGHPEAAAVRSIMMIIGIGALLAGIAGGVAGGVAGVALGGFIGIVIGFASQQVLGQAIAGVFLLLARPFKIGDYVTLGGETGTVEDVTSLFTMVKKDDGTIVLIPNNTIIGNKIYLLKKPQTQTAK